MSTKNMPKLSLRDWWEAANFYTRAWARSPLHRYMNEILAYPSARSVGLSAGLTRTGSPLISSGFCLDSIAAEIC